MTKGEISGVLFNGTRIIIGLIMFAFVCTVPASAQNSRNDTSYLTTASEVATTHNWTFKKYMCQNFATDLLLKLSAEGYQVKMKRGRWFNLGNEKCSDFNYKYFRCYHFWILVKINNKWIPIEPQLGNVIDPETYKKEYK
jgi:hypothetical protein